MYFLLFTAYIRYPAVFLLLLPCLSVSRSRSRCSTCHQMVLVLLRVRSSSSLMLSSSVLMCRHLSGHGMCRIIMTVIYWWTVSLRSRILPFQILLLTAYADVLFVQNRMWTQYSGLWYMQLPDNRPTILRLHDPDRQDRLYLQLCTVQVNA